MAGVPRSMVSLVSQRSRTTTSASTASGQRSPRPRHRCMSGLWTWAGNHAQAGLAQPGRHGVGRLRVFGDHQNGRLAGSHPSASFLRHLAHVGCHRTSGHGQTPPAERGIRLYGTGPDWKSLRSVRKETLAGEARFDAKSEHLGRQEAPRINSQDCQTAAHARAATSFEDGRRGARPSSLSTGLAGGGARPMALDPHPRRRSGHDRLA
jgi:hypothetical protein